MAPSASSAFYARQIPPVEFHLSSRNSPTFQITLRRYANSIFKQSPWVSAARTWFRFANDRRFPVLEFQSEFRGECTANNANVHWSLLATTLRFRFAWPSGYVQQS